MPQLKDKDAYRYNSVMREDEMQVNLFFLDAGNTSAMFFRQETWATI